MKMFKMFALLASLSVGLVACSEGSYTPTTTTNGVVGTGINPVYNNGYPNGYQTGLGNTIPGTVNPGFMQPGIAGVIRPGIGINGGLYINPWIANPNNYYANLNMQAQAAMQANALSMYSCAARANPNFYLYTSTTSNCSLRREPTYTPTSCACIRAPCDCDLVLTQCRDRRSSRSSSSSSRSSSSSSSRSSPCSYSAGTCGSGSGSSGSYSEVEHYETRKDGTRIRRMSSSTSYVADTTLDPVDPTPTTHVSPTTLPTRPITTNPTTPVGSITPDESGIDPNSSTAQVQISKGDAEALFNLIAKKAEKVGSSWVRTGKNYQCTHAKDDKNTAHSEYYCDIDIAVSNGHVYEQSKFPTTADADPVKAVSPYDGLSVTIDSKGLNPAEGYINVNDSYISGLIFKHLSGQAHIGSFDGTTANVKSGQQVTCYEIPETKTYVCRVKVLVATGAAENAN